MKKIFLLAGILFLAGCQMDLGVVHPAASQPTATGREISDIAYHDGKLYVGYGDWSANTGPIDIMSYDLNSKTWNYEVTARTEAAHNIEVIDDKVWVLYTDPTATGDLLRRNNDGTWTELSLGTDGREAFLHVFDMASSQGSLWLVGSQRTTNAGLVMRSTDGGNTWSQSLVDYNDKGWNRFYTALVINGELHVRGSGTWHDDSGWDTDHYRFDGQTWHYDPMNILGGYTYQPAVSVGDKAGAVFWNNGFIASSDGHNNYISQGIGPNAGDIAPATDVTSHSDTAYAVLTNGEIHSSNDLVNWSFVAQGPENPTSLTTDGNAFYVGTADSKVFAVYVD